MSSLQEHLSKLREERHAKEKARIEKLKELNLKKYNKTEPPKPTFKVPATNSVTKNEVKNTSTSLKNNIPINNITKRPITAPNNRKSIAVNNTIPNHHKNQMKNNEKLGVLAEEEKPKTCRDIVITHNNTRRSVFNFGNTSGISNDPKKPTDDKKVTNLTTSGISIDLKKPTDTKKDFIKNCTKDFIASNKNIPKRNVSEISVRKSVAPNITTPRNLSKTSVTRKSYLPPKLTQSGSNVDTKRLSVFERLYQPKPKIVQKKNVTDAEKIQNDPTLHNKIIKNTSDTLGKGDFIVKRNVSARRSISAVHFRRISKYEFNCVYKSSSIGEKLDKVHLKDIDEDAAVKDDKIVSAVKSEHKKVKFQTPVSNFNSPKPEELQAKLQSWLKKRGKSMDSFQHLQCFGIQHLAKNLKPLNLNLDKFDQPKPNSLKTDELEELRPSENATEQFEDYLEDEDKENKPLESDSDDGSYDEIMNNKCRDGEKALNGNKEDAATKWRRASYISESPADLNSTRDTTLTTEPQTLDEVAMAALNDLTLLLREGYPWEQCARWLRAIRERVPSVPHSGPYWECRAELESRRGDLPASVRCWEQACAQGTEPSVVDANLDQLLDKFMQLNISPSSGQRSQPNPKLVDVKNVFKSTLIKFAVQQAKMRRSEERKLIVTPVRRSGRLSAAWSGRKSFRPPLVEFSHPRKVPRTSLLEYTTLKEAEKLNHPVFVPNDTLCQTP